MGKKKWGERASLTKARSLEHWVKGTPELLVKSLRQMDQHIVQWSTQDNESFVASQQNTARH